MKVDRSRILSPFFLYKKSNRTVLTVGVVAFIYFYSNHGNEACYGGQKNGTLMGPENRETLKCVTNKNRSSNCSAHFSAWQADALYRAKRLALPSCRHVFDIKLFL
jgi:hypothetical protein